MALLHVFYLQVMPCLSTTVLQQRRGEFHGLLRIFVVVSLVLTAVADAALIRYHVLPFLIVSGPFVLYHVAYADLLGTARFHRSFKLQHKRHEKQKRRAQRKADSDAAAAKFENKRAGEKASADAEAEEKKSAASKATFEAETERQQHQKR